MGLNEYKEILDNSTITCADCGKSLIDIIILEHDISTCKKVLVHCCFCGGTSFSHKIFGVSYMQPIETISISNMPTEIEPDNTISIIIETIKNE
jgi:hypothetical protein